MHQIAPFKDFWRACPRTPLQAHGFATCKFPNLEKIILAPPPQPNPGYVPGLYPPSGLTNVPVVVNINYSRPYIHYNYIV